ncbi:hypothetical protein GTG23_07065 [Rhodococcus hoagii]|nr:hypothetical protein [Prescottella equi]NKZ63095.1 hypothetical protein [Prescottella equi]NKZ64022.1 hypothetical protein [Prescottella equi]
MSEKVELAAIRHPKINPEVMAAAVAGFTNMSVRMAESAAKGAAEAGHALARMAVAEKVGWRQ